MKPNSMKPHSEIKYSVLPRSLKKGNSTYLKTKYGSYVPSDQEGMAAQKNAMSYEELIKLGYK